MKTSHNIATVEISDTFPALYKCRKDDSIVLFINKGECIVLDAGNGVEGQGMLLTTKADFIDVNHVEIWERLPVGTEFTLIQE